MLIVVAVGGNSLIRSDERGTMEEQLANVETTARAVGELVAAGHRVLVTHGNGPQVGNLLLMSERTTELPGLPLDYWGANTQGGIGYQLQSALHRELRHRGVERQVLAVVTRVEVDADDPAFDEPSKPVGPFYSAEQARRYAAESGWVVREDAGRGWRRVVASPKPVAVVELAAIERLLAAGVVTIAVGGGGIPVVRDDGGHHGVEAVIDKDRASSLTARLLGADLLAVSTDVERVQLDYGTPQAKPIDRISATEMRRHFETGQFPKGSMGPKVQAALDYLDAGGKRVVITDPANLAAAVLEDAAGTRIAP